MADLDLRVKLIGKLLARQSVATMSPEQLARAQAARIPHNRVTDYLLGGVARGAQLRDTTVAGAQGTLPARVYRPAGPGSFPLVVNFHGGGWTLGNLDSADWLCSSVAVVARVVVVSVDYRLAPAHPFPAAVEDCFAATVDVAARAAELGAEGQLAVMGDSAGGNLAAVVSLLARDRGGPDIAFQGLIYPATDLTDGSPSIEENAHAPILTRTDMEAFGRHYLGAADRRDPLVSPLFAADHAGLPRALVQVAEHDPIRDDGLRYAAALRAAGVPVRTTTYVGMPHGFLAFPRLCRSAPQALAELCAELHDALAPS